jgi:hypothetical protein
MQVTESGNLLRLQSFANKLLLELAYISRGNVFQKLRETGLECFGFLALMKLLEY